jgi:hypothetical protein
MSEFTCSKGHVMASGDLVCRLCGGRVRYMDGMSDREIRGRERDGERMTEDESEEEDKNG